MTQTYVTQQGDMIDGLAWRFYGQISGAAEAIFAANPGLAAEEPILPENVVIELPALRLSPAPPKGTVNLWD